MKWFGPDWITQDSAGADIWERLKYQKKKKKNANYLLSCSENAWWNATKCLCASGADKAQVAGFFAVKKARSARKGQHPRAKPQPIPHCQTLVETCAGETQLFTSLFGTISSFHWGDVVVHPKSFQKHQAVWIVQARSIVSRKVQRWCHSLSKFFIVQCMWFHAYCFLCLLMRCTPSLWCWVLLIVLFKPAHKITQTSNMSTVKLLQ